MRLCAASGLTGVARPRHRSRYWDPADGGPHPASIKRIRECWNVKPTPRDKGEFKGSLQHCPVDLGRFMGLYLNPPEKAVVVCVDENTQVRTGPPRSCRSAPAYCKGDPTTSASVP